jgi:chorismate mutase
MAALAELRNQVNAMASAISQLMAERDEARSAAAAAQAQAGKGRHPHPPHPPPSHNILGANMNELQKLSKPNKLEKKSEYSDWVADLDSYLSLVHPKLSEAIQTIQNNSIIEYTATTDEEKEISRILFHTLKGLTAGLPKKVVKSQTNQNGFEAFRKLHQRMGDTDPEGETQLLIAIINFQFGKSIAEVEEKILKFEELCEQYDKIPSVVGIADNIKYQSSPRAAPL